MESAIPYLTVSWLFLFNCALDLVNENSILLRCGSHGGWFLAATNRLSATSNPTQYFAWDILDPEHSVSGVVPTSLLLAYRGFALLFFGFTLLYQGLWGSTFGSPSFNWLTFFTNWTFVGFGIYASFGTLLLVTELKKKDKTPLTQWPTFNKCFALIFEVVTSSAIFLAIFYWVAVYGGGHVELDNVARHGLNVIILLGDLLLSRIPVATYHFQACFGYGSVYAVFMWIYHAISGDWKYTALNWNNRSSLGYYIALPFLYLFSFTLMYIVAFVRERLFDANKMQRTYSRLEPPAALQMTDIAVVK